MDEAVKETMTRRSTWLRGIYMLLFGLIYNVAEIVLLALAVLQFILKLLTGRPNGHLLVFGQSLSVYVYQIWRFLSFNSELLPFPFAPWPDGSRGADAPSPRPGE